MSLVHTSGDPDRLVCGRRAGSAGRPGSHRVSCCPPPAGDSGFTLVELLVTVMILSVGIMGVVQVLAVAERHTSHARDETRAISLSQEIREKIMCENFDDVYSIFNGIDSDNPGSVPTVAQDWVNHIHSQMGPTGRGTVQVTTPDTDAGITNGMRGIVITISWNERGRTISLPMRFAIAKTSP